MTNLPAVEQEHEHDEPPDNGGARFLRSRVRSLNRNSLHSVAYMSHLASYLDQPSQKPSLQYLPDRAAVSSARSDNVFLYSYSLAHPEQPNPRVYQEVSQFQSADEDKQAELVFLTGYPSPQWLNAVVTRYGIDHRFLHRHLDFLPTGQRDWYAIPSVPSRSQQFIQIVVPCIVFTGHEGRFVPAEDLQQARFACAELLRQKSKSFFGRTGTPAGQTIVRGVNIHSGEAMVLEHAITVCVRTDGEASKMWSDAASDDISNYIPVPEVNAFRNVVGALECCPVFFEKHLDTQPPRSRSIAPGSLESSVQALSVLATDYGHTLEWSAVQQDPVLALEELLAFQSVAAMQYLNMLRKDITQAMHRNQTIDVASLNMEDISNFEYTKAILVRWAAHFRTLCQALGPDCPGSPLAPRSHGMSPSRERMLTLKRRDLDFLAAEAQVLIELCDSGKATIMGNFSIAESRRMAEESRLVGQLNKLTNRLTFIFLPTSFVTSVFGMNFKQFGQGPLDIWIWVAVTVPLLAVCVILVEWRISVRALVEKAWARLRRPKSLGGG
ncbi:uncharacterized protein BO72DRAFT_488208 [Aspergillus fijiensis CBS 313.89]|uniref:Uncharacterized protein n=1 Tax=Aspergillus fijiensis CBS 313.89 TaxID=1448319 RepID=A0A8G1RJJ9_9EURO|nr:uncharacterized protein BO72DRAFT_488208 [Aspergillus fijiensis CBS 313.89]RAK74454.1 hypothetical protein BO72DRAFT_488208 [Aspergillus fijiensis CBS 313.89]